MTCQELDKVVAAQTLEATKEVLQHLQQWAAQLEEKGEYQPREMTQLYGQVRRIRDYINRSIPAHTHPVTLDLDERDCNLLASCCVFALQSIAMQLRYKRDLAEGDRIWFESKRDNLSKLVLELATDEVKVIPSQGGPKPIAPAVRRVLDLIRAKLFKSVPSATSPQPPKKGG